MGRTIRILTLLICVVAACSLLAGCSDKSKDADATVSTTQQEAASEDTSDDKATQDQASQEAAKESLEEDDYTEGLGDTFSGDTDSPDNDRTKASEEEEEAKNEDKDVDLILFMGQSNMSGAGGDASIAPHVPEEAGMEFRAISDPTRLYPITEPFGINENNPTGLYEYPGAKKGSLVSAFVNEYHKLTGRRVVAVSISMGATDMNKWITPGAAEDVKQRFSSAVSYLKDNGYKIGHMYALWLHGESDALGGTDPDVYKTCLDDVMRPLFIGGVRKVFIITPGRTIDYKDIFNNIVKVQKEICAESDYYALATTALTKVSTEYMLDQYHYNQHVLNMIGIESAKAVAYYTEHNVEKIIYDYREHKDIIPDGVDPDSQEKEDHIHFDDININELY